MTKQYALALIAGLATSGVAQGQGCPADCNGDGELTIIDFVCYQGEWEDQTEFGDCNGDGVYNIVDYVCYQSLFQDGCPDGNPIDEDFDDYDLGDICGQGPWEGWFLNPDACAQVSDEQALSPDQSMKLIGSEGPLGDDVVIVLDPVIEGGQWTYTVQTFVPDDATGTAWIIALNQYNHDGIDLNWSLQVRLDATLGTVESDFDGGLAILQTGEWVPFRAEIDLDADLQNFFYNGDQFVFDKSWTEGVSGGGLPQIQAIDCYASEPGGGGTTGTYYDDIVLSPGID